MSDNVLDEKLYAKIVKLCAKGDELADNDQYSDALEIFNIAFDLIPEPYTKWKASTWILSAIGEMHFFMDNFTEAREAFTDAMHCPDALGNTFIHLRLGQVQYELGNEKRAKDELMRAYMGGRYEIFKDEDQKYYNFIKKYIIFRKK